MTPVLTGWVCCPARSASMLVLPTALSRQVDIAISCSPLFDWFCFDCASSLKVASSKLRDVSTDHFYRDWKNGHTLADPWHFLSQHGSRDDGIAQNSTFGSDMFSKLLVMFTCCLCPPSSSLSVSISVLWRMTGPEDTGRYWHWFLY